MTTLKQIMTSPKKSLPKKSLPASSSGSRKSKTNIKARPLVMTSARAQSATSPQALTNLAYAADPEQMKKFILRVHGSDAAVYQTFSKDPELAANSQIFKSVRGKRLRDRLLKHNLQQRMNVAMLLNTSRDGSRRRESITKINAVFIDSDDRKLKIDDLQSLKLRPHIVVETSPGRFHAYWFVKDCSVDRFASIQKALAERFGTDPSVCDPGRVMRLPGTVNWKRQPPFVAQIVREREGSGLSVSLLIKKLDLTVSPLGTKTKTQTKAAAKKARGTTTDGATQGLTDALAARVRRALHGVPADERLLWWRIGTAIHSAAPTDEGYDLWTEWSMTSGKFDEEVQRSTWNAFKTSGGINIETLFWLANQVQKEASAFDDTDAARLFAATYVDRLRYDPQRRQWYLFDGVIWREDGAAPTQLAFKLIDDLSTGDGRQDPALKRYRGSAGPRAIVSQAELLEDLRVSEAMFDHDINLLAVKNGVIDLRTSVFRAAHPTDYLRRCADVAYDVDARSPVWRKFLTEVTCGDKELEMYLRRAVGYTLYGHANEQIFFMPEGSGSNGKGVFMRTIKAILGTYAGVVPPNLLTSAYSGNANGPSPALAALKGIRMGIVSEMVQKRSFDTAFIKQFAGGDEITARANYGDQFTFKPEGKLWVSTNEMPEIAATDDAMWRRLTALPFKGVFKGKNRDNDLEEKLLAERAGILNWMLNGARTYHAQGLGKCNAVDEHARKLRKQADTLSSWISEACERGPGAALQASVAYSSYQGYVKRLGGAPISSHKFRERMEGLGFTRTKTKSSNRYVGLKLIDANK